MKGKTIGLGLSASALGLAGIVILAGRSVSEEKIQVPEVGEAVAVTPNAQVAVEFQPAGHWDDDDSWGGGRRACKAYDRGWEEHWGGHGGWGASRESACSSCKKPTGPHGRCRYECFREAYRCTAEWVPNDSGKSHTTYTGERRSSRSDAEESAVNRCMRDNWSNSSEGRCRFKDCDSDQITTDTGDC